MKTPGSAYGHREPEEKDDVVPLDREKELLAQMFDTVRYDQEYPADFILSVDPDLDDDEVEM